ncbi:MAG: isoprenyl transferase [Hyphomonas sp.]|uniref:isoprenyl transferase n=1 Tax=Hyphomonas sp. TaxID=87 RepID=UPI0017DC4476|nr:isoprenyl transferase [Hyphomonas sp.]MBA3069667.1 isoprenyl transferase [Hyphomonas sp.]MBU4062508.1 isoprenyl transferase [Alphaproteobacteria bacterium]MBU4163859.1 isoprenyl transferase [Alphaproteobacteria bacterium]MBU4569597.1 isoprenyl transferase [Alphaproteobacteria bacterium]
MVRIGISPDPSHSGGEPPAPRHVAIIMDGNGRWANSRGLPRTAGHERGVEALRRTVEAARDLGISYLTVFSFSTENWRRPASEVNTLFGLLKAYVQRDLERLKQDGVRIRVIGQREGLPADIAALVDRAERETAHNTRFHLTIAFNYGSRNEILRAATAYAQAIADGTCKGAATEDGFAAFLDTRDLPDPDLVIRTSGEFRISNFLLWQAAYAELLFVDVLWPDFNRAHLESAISRYHERERRFGSVNPGAT